MRLVIALVLVAGCRAESDEFAVSPGGGGGSIGSGGSDEPDAGIDGNDSGANGLVGRVCVLSDLRQPSVCNPTGAGDIVVTLGTRIATTLDDGAFVIQAPTGSNLVWHATGQQIVTSAQPFSTSTLVPAVTVAGYDDLLSANGILMVPGQGSIVAQVVQATNPVVDATATVSPVSQFALRYDGASSTTWDQDATGTLGVVWITGAAVGPTTVRVTPPLGAAVNTTLLVEDQAITFGVVEIP